MSKNHTPSFILASASPRRKHLLSKAGFSFKVIPSNIDEALFDAESVSSVEHTLQLAIAKAIDIAIKYPEKLVMGADTIVDFKGKIIGKPKDSEEAEQFTRLLFSAPHKVITSVAVIRVEKKLELADTAITTVYPKRLTEKQISEHIKSDNWQGKAGAYGIQESGDEFVAKIEGSFTNVMGLPMELVDQLLIRASRQ